MKEHLYTAIAERVAADVPEIQWLDRFNSQPDRRTEMYAYPLPALFIQFAQINWSSLGQDAQTASVVVALHLEQINYADSHYISYAQEGLIPSQQKEMSLKRDRLMEQVHRAMQGYAGDCFTPLTRIAETPDEGFAQSTVDVAQYSCVLEDAGAQLADFEPDSLRLSGELGV